MALARAGWRAGTYPAHHLFGTAGLGEEVRVIDLPLSDTGLWPKLNGRTQYHFGNLEQQAAAVAKLRPGSVIYGAQAQDLASLALLRRARVLPIPIVGVIHGKSAYGSLARMAIAGFDHIIVLSEMTKRSLIETGIDGSRISVLPWGPDLELPGFRAAKELPADRGVVATGKTGRDMRLLIEAMSKTGMAGRIYGNRSQLESEVDIPANVDVLPAAASSALPGRPFTYDHTLADLQRAAVVAIPLRERYPLHGLTELADAVACGKPVIMTRAPYFDVDIEAVGCGWWVDPDDLEGWCDRLRDAMSDAERLAAMGRRGRKWSEQHWNSKLFAAGVKEVLLKTRKR